MSNEGKIYNLICDAEGARVDAYTADVLSREADAASGEAPAGASDELPEDGEDFAEAEDNALIYRTFSRSSVQRLIESGLLTVNGEPCKANRRLKAGDAIRVELPAPEPIDAEPENIPLDIVYEDGDIVVINKPAGMVVHPAAGNEHGTLVNAVLYHCTDLSDINGAIRPGIVHRIDKDTTGLICVAKNNAAHLALAAQLKTHTMARVYFAVTEGCPKEEEGTVSLTVGRHPVERKKMAAGVANGRDAVTHYRVIEAENGLALIRCRLETGRTHQIRVHMAALGHPIAGDPLYGIKNKRGLSGQLLHAGRLTLIHPGTGEEMTFRAPLPKNFSDFLRKNGFDEAYFGEWL